MANAQARVLVTGAAGYLGHHVVAQLRANDVPVRALVGPQFVGGPSAARVAALQAAGAEVVERDVREPGAFDGLCNSVHTVVCCLAANPTRPGNGTFVQIDRDATIALFEALLAAVGPGAAASAAGTNAASTSDSSQDVFSPASTLPPAHFVLLSTFEGRQARQVSRLHQAKEQAVDHIAARAEACGVRATIVRPTAYYKDFTDYPWRALKRSGRVTVFGSGASLFNAVDGAELAAFLTVLILAPEATLAAAGKRASQAAEAAAAAVAAGTATDAQSALSVAEALPSASASGLTWQLPVGGPEIMSLRDVIEAAAVAQGLPPGCHVRSMPLGLLHWAALPLLRAAAAVLPTATGAGMLAAGIEFLAYAAENHSVAALSIGKRTVAEYYADKGKAEAAAQQEEQLKARAAATAAEE